MKIFLVMAACLVAMAASGVAMPVLDQSLMPVTTIMTPSPPGPDIRPS
jgi:hypothetical protein